MLSSYFTLCRVEWLKTPPAGYFLLVYIHYIPIFIVDSNWATELRCCFVIYWLEVRNTYENEVSVSWRVCSALLKNSSLFYVAQVH